VFIIYGPFDDHTASSLPLSKTSTFDPNETFYVTEARLNGAGNITCTTTIRPTGGSPLVESASAAGGRSIAMAELCTTLSGTWVKCAMPTS
jgi:hypothetical protein